MEYDVIPVDYANEIDPLEGCNFADTLEPNVENSKSESIKAEIGGSSSALSTNNHHSTLHLDTRNQLMNSKKDVQLSPRGHHSLRRQIPKIVVKSSDDKVSTQASTMREVLASIPGLSIKKRRTTKKMSTAAQIEQTREGCIDLETPDSILVGTNLRELLNKHTFSILPPFYQLKLIQLLPSVDRPSIENDQPNDIRLSSSSLNNEFFARACLEWRERLAEGEFTPENQSKLRSEAEKEKSKLDPWKLKHFEPLWGDKTGQQHAPPIKRPALKTTIKISPTTSIMSSTTSTVNTYSITSSSSSLSPSSSAPVKIASPDKKVVRTVGAVTRAVAGSMQQTPSPSPTKISNPVPDLLPIRTKISRPVVSSATSGATISIVQSVDQTDMAPTTIVVESAAITEKLETIVDDQTDETQGVDEPTSPVYEVIEPPPKLPVSTTKVDPIQVKRSSLKRVHESPIRTEPQTTADDYSNYHHTYSDKKEKIDDSISNESSRSPSYSCESDGIETSDCQSNQGGQSPSSNSHNHHHLHINNKIIDFIEDDSCKNLILEDSDSKDFYNITESGVVEQQFNHHHLHHHGRVIEQGGNLEDVDEEEEIDDDEVLDDDEDDVDDLNQQQKTFDRILNITHQDADILLEQDQLDQHDHSHIESDVDLMSVGEMSEANLIAFHHLHHHHRQQQEEHQQQNDDQDDPPAGNEDEMSMISSSVATCDEGSNSNSTNNNGGGTLEECDDGGGGASVDNSMDTAVDELEPSIQHIPLELVGEDEEVEQKLTDAENYIKETTEGILVQNTLDTLQQYEGKSSSSSEDDALQAELFARVLEESIPAGTVIVEHPPLEVPPDEPTITLTAQQSLTESGQLEVEHLDENHFDVTADWACDMKVDSNPGPPELGHSVDDLNIHTTDESSSSKSMGEMLGDQPNDLILYENLDEIKLEGDVRLTTAETEVSSTVINSLAGGNMGGGCGGKKAPSLEPKYFNAFSISNSFALPSGSMVAAPTSKPHTYTTSKIVITQPSSSSSTSSSSSAAVSNSSAVSAASTIVQQIGQPNQIVQTIGTTISRLIKQEPTTSFGETSERRNFETISTGNTATAIIQPNFMQQKNHQPSNLLHQDSRVQPTTVMAAGSSGAVFIPSRTTVVGGGITAPITTVNNMPTISTAMATTTTGGVRGVTQTIIRPKHHSGRGGGRTGRTSSNCKPPPGAVNFERSYQICQAVIQSSPNRNQLRAKLCLPPSQLATANPGSQLKKDDQTQNSAVTSSNKMTIMRPSQPKTGNFVQRKPSPVLVRQIYNQSGVPMTLVSATGSSGQQTQNATLQSQLENSASNPGVTNNVGQYILVQRVRINENLTPRASSAPPAQNQQQIHGISGVPISGRGRPASVDVDSNSTMDSQSNGKNVQIHSISKRQQIGQGSPYSDVGMDSSSQNSFTVTTEENTPPNCSCSLSPMVICQQCGAFCHNYCINSLKLCNSCVIR